MKFRIKTEDDEVYELDSDNYDDALVEAQEIADLNNIDTESATLEVLDWGDFSGEEQSLSDLIDSYLSEDAEDLVELEA